MYLWLPMLPNKITFGFRESFSWFHVTPKEKPLEKSPRRNCEFFHATGDIAIFEAFFKQRVLSLCISFDHFLNGNNRYFLW
jgi:hypothetical protein